MEGEEMFQATFFVGFVLWIFCGGVLLRQRKKSGRVLAMICFIVLLAGFPVGTVFGILGIIWLNKGRHLLQ